MRVNIYAEEMTDRVELVSKKIQGRTFTGVRFYFGFPFHDRDGDNDTSAITFWGKHQLRDVFEKAIRLIDEHYTASPLSPQREEVQP